MINHFHGFACLAYGCVSFTSQQQQQQQQEKQQQLQQNCDNFINI